MTIKRIFIYILLVVALLVVGRFIYIRIAYDFELQHKVALAVAEVRMKWLKITRDTQDTDKANLDDSTLISFNTTECHGFCPVYDLSLYGSGRAEFKGEKYVCKANQISHLDKQLVRDLAIKLKLIGFENYADFQHMDVTDRQTYRVSFKHKNSEHNVNHYLGDLTAPTELTLVEKDILAIVDKMAVLGTYSPAGLVCTMEGRTADLIPWVHWSQAAEEPEIIQKD
ncbi:hypothetical protein GCM10011613_26250 [Cellvibrio zantedeschiae]|uniref:DUF6438 domain-containing protein n=1 Tax=Cellvibrio zantedeschiae TaxID=1237077 RepID=A0ABQ3B5D0_9GAMM|nr:DUF6438 domain-containing protein [Cellvibrio zantedeschiae]GGY79995.1 hypothetical protein GCM10011613_26250 [Cellvibrio zantedeschiae]